MHVAANRATGGYLLFTDADVFFSPDLLRKAVTMCERGGSTISHRWPRLESSGFFEKVLELYFVVMLCIASQPWLVRTGWRFSYVGVGAFNLVRRSAYAQCGGHTAIRLDVLDDVKLGKLIKHTGLKQDVLDAGRGSARAVAGGFWGVIRGLEKNGFSVFDYSLVKLSFASVFMIATSLFPYCAIVLWPDARGLGFLFSILYLHCAGAFGALLLGFGPAASAGLPVAAATMIFTMWRSAFFTLVRRGVRWRDTFYPLSLLREQSTRSLFMRFRRVLQFTFLFGASFLPFSPLRPEQAGDSAAGKPVVVLWPDGAPGARWSCGNRHADIDRAPSSTGDGQRLRRGDLSGGRLSTSCHRLRRKRCGRMVQYVRRGWIRAQISAGSRLPLSRADARRAASDPHRAGQGGRVEDRSASRGRDGILRRRSPGFDRGDALRCGAA